MKVILSRKGFDSAAGGYASPIMSDGTLLSLPIPDISGEISYQDLVYNGESYLHILKQLVPKDVRLEKERLKLDKGLKCHFDPDLVKNIYSREPGWRGLFGQRGAAETHLQNNQISIGDIFIFFGWFRKTKYENRRKYDSNDKTGKHIIYGYLEVGQIVDLSKEKVPSWANYHPHVNKSSNNNRLYIASEKLSFDNSLPGYGVFKYNNQLVLTKNGYSRSSWDLPECFSSLEITYHNQKSWKTEYFQCASRGQEFIIEENIEVTKWAQNIIQNSERV